MSCKLVALLGRVRLPIIHQPVAVDDTNTVTQGSTLTVANGNAKDVLGQRYRFKLGRADGHRYSDWGRG